jgi:hypothetical protein
LQEAREDRKAGRITAQTIDEHIADLKNG